MLACAWTGDNLLNFPLFFNPLLILLLLGRFRSMICLSIFGWITYFQKSKLWVTYIKRILWYNMNMYLTKYRKLRKWFFLSKFKTGSWAIEYLLEIDLQIHYQEIIGFLRGVRGPGSTRRKKKNCCVLLAWSVWFGSILVWVSN